MSSQRTIPVDLSQQARFEFDPASLAVHRQSELGSCGPGICSGVDRLNLRQVRGLFDRMQEELRRARLELRELRPLAGTGLMTHLIAHDLRNYLCAINANMEFMAEAKTLQEGSDELVEDARSAIRGMTDMLDSLLLFARTGEALQPRFTSLNVLLENAISLIRMHPDAQNVELVVEQVLGVKAFVDCKKLGRAVYNLLLNACQAAKRGIAPGRVALRLSEDQDSIRIQVEDNGPGVPNSIRHALYKPFVSTRTDSGTGLGLTIVECTAREHGGTVDLVESYPGRTVFTVQFPKTALQALAAGAFAAKRPKKSTTRHRRGEVRSGIQTLTEKGVDTARRDKPAHCRG
jgi:signal transduction histidine kinase